MKFVQFILGLLFVLLTTACGGGGGSPGSSPGTTQELFTSAPETLNLAVAGSESFVVSGGKAPYFASTDNKAVVVAGIQGSSLTIGGISVGAGTIKLIDSAGAEKLVAVTVGTVTPPVGLFTTAPSSITLAPNTRTPTFEVKGGEAPYFVTSANTSTVTVSQTGASFVLNGLAAGPATNVNIVDSLGASKTIVVTVAAIPLAPMALTPGDAAGVVGDVLSLLLSGGSGTYTSGSAANASIATVSLSGATLTVSLRNAGVTQVSVRDSNGTIVTANITVNGLANPALRLSATDLDISESLTTEATVGIFGGQAPYSSFVNNASLASSRVSGSTLYLGLGANGNRCVDTNTDVQFTVIDSVGASANGTLTIVNSGDQLVSGCNKLPLAASVGSSVPLALSDTLEFTVTGGTAPYAVISSNQAFVTVAPVMSPVYRLTPVREGTTSITIRDAVGAQFIIAVTVKSELPLVTTADPSVFIAAEHTETFIISGGTAPYAAESSLPETVSVFLSGNNLSLTAKTEGNASITVTDSAGTPARVVGVTVVPKLTVERAGDSGTILAIAGTGVSAQQSFTISGGQPTYSADSSNTSVVVASVTGSTLTIRPVAVGTATITVRDAASSFGPDIVYTVNVTP